MNPSNLRYFVHVARTLNFRAASSSLSISQPALSSRIKRLEDELGFHLFVREKPRISLTKAGQAFLPFAEKVLTEVETAKEAAAAITNGHLQPLRIGYTPVSFFGYVPGLFRQFGEQNPEFTFVFRELLSDDVARKLLDGSLDVGVLHPPHIDRGLDLHPLISERYVVVLHESNPLVARETLSFKDLADQPFITVSRSVGPAIHDRIFDLAKRAGYKPNVVQEVTTSIALLGLVAAGQGIGLVIEPLRTTARPGLVFRDLSGEVPSLPFAAATNKVEASLGATKFHSFLKKVHRNGGFSSW